MWGTAGSMLACVFMHALTGEGRFEALYRTQAARLPAALEDVDGVRLWTQEIYGQSTRYLGLVHGLAGNILAFVRGWHWLDAEQQRLVADVTMQTLAATAKHAGAAANWPANADLPDAPTLCQVCHGAPGILVGVAGAPFSSPDFDRLLVEAGNLVWSAGPLKKGSNFCHGTGGNAYAMLMLYKRTGDALWLERARAFAMHSVAQFHAATREYGRSRYSLWTHCLRMPRSDERRRHRSARRRSRARKRVPVSEPQVPMVAARNFSTSRSRRTRVCSSDK